MAQSGVKVDSETIQSTYKQLQQGKGQIGYMVAYIQDKKLITLDPVLQPAPGQGNEFDEAANKQLFDSLKEQLSEDEPRYIFFDFRFMNNDSKQAHIAFLFWCSDNCPVQKKMLYASSKDSIKKACAGVQVEFQANEKADLNYDEFKDEVAKAKCR